jgi:hypothetical protein
MQPVKKLLVLRPNSTEWLSSTRFCVILVSPVLMKEVIRSLVILKLSKVQFTCHTKVILFLVGYVNVSFFFTGEVQFRSKSIVPA